MRLRKYTVGQELSHVIIGNGIAGITAAELLRAEDTNSTITIIADDPFPVYYRPALKDYLGGKVSEAKLWARPHTFYQEQRIRFVSGRVMGIHAAQHRIQLHTGQLIGYDTLLLANGARAKTLSCPGLDLAGVSTLRTVADYQQIVRRLEHAQRIVVCGSGTLALESAESLNHLGYRVTHLLRHNVLWSEVLDATASDMVLHEERHAGIDVQTEEEIREIVGKNGQVTGVVTTRGTRIACDMVLIAIGIDPNIDFIQASGITCGRGVHVDERMRTNLPDIYAAGDVLETIDAHSGRARVLGQWYPAIQQAQRAAQSMLGNTQRIDTGAFYNATFLHGLDFVSIGQTVHAASQSLQEIVAEPQPRNYRKVWLEQGILVGALLLGKRTQGLAFKRALDQHVNLSPVAHCLFSETFNLQEWLDTHHVSPVISNQALHTASSTGDNPSRRGLLSGRYTTHLPTIQSPQATQQAFPAQEAPFSRTMTSLLPASVLDALPASPTLIIVAKDAAPQLVSLGKHQRYVLGRDATCDIHLDDSASSRRHAELFTTHDGFYIRDLASSNGVFVNGVKINNAYHLAHEDAIIIGNLLLYFSFPQAIAAIRTTKGTSTLPVKQPVAVGLKHREHIQALSQEHVHFEIDMCIGCDRCMSSCPVPLSSQVSIADLNYATTTQQVAPHVARFTHECIMCGSCVPVCPVDNHRDLLMLSLKQRIGASWEGEVDVQRMNSVLPMNWTIPQLIGLLREQVIFRDTQQIPDNYLLHLFSSSHLLSLQSGTTLLREGEYGRDLYLLLDGSISLYATEADGKEFAVTLLTRGEHLGEYGMLTGQPYLTTARTQTPSLILHVPEQVMHRCMELVPQVQHYFDQLHNTHSLKFILKRMALFQGVSDVDIQRLCEQTQVKQYNRNECLFAEDNRDTGRQPARETLHILLEGFVKVARRTPAGMGHDHTNERILAYRQGGDYFAGGLDLLGDSRAVTVTSINRTRVAEVPRTALLALFQRYPEVMQRFMFRLRDYIDSTASVDATLLHPQVLKHTTAFAPSHPDVHASLESLVNDGVVEGTEVLVIDLDLCIHCSECEEACARRHGHSRLNRKGMVVGNISIATACRQCQDPVCLLCSRAGIARLPDGEVYITESCIGCGICAKRCPYGAISIVDAEEKREETPSSWQQFSNIFKHGIAKERPRKPLPMAQMASRSTRVAPGPLDLTQQQSGYDELRKKIAIKCDLCAGYNDQACVEACPTGATIRVQPTRFFGSTEEILQR